MTTQFTFCQWRYFRTLTFNASKQRCCSSKMLNQPMFSRLLATETAVKLITKKKPLKPVIGLEIHAQILAKSKLFSGASTSYGSRVNTCVSHFDAAIPGTLPVINRRCVEAAVLTSLALGCKINLNSSFDRKHYFYADMPAGYQITQHFNPIARDGLLEFVVVPKSDEDEDEEEGMDPIAKKINITQVQIEQDSGKSIHDAANAVSLIDLNRAGHGLLEIVTAPEFEGSGDAVAFASELKLLLECLGVCEGNMNRGNFRIDANVSLHREGDPLGVRTEIKNLNSLKSVRNAIDYEITRQTRILESGGVVVNETLGYDRFANKTVPMRDKEIVTDYRFFPEPNLPPLRLSTSRRVVPGAVDVDALSSKLPEFPEDVRRRYIERWRLTRRQSAALVGSEGLAPFFDKIMECLNAMAPDMLSLPARVRVPLPPPPKPCPPLLSQFWRYIHPPLSLTVSQRVVELLLHYIHPIVEELERDLRIALLSKGESSFSFEPETSTDLDIRDLSLTPEHVATLAILLERDRVSPVVCVDLLKRLSSRKDVVRVEELIGESDWWMISDEAWIRSHVRDALLADARVLKELKKDNPKKTARAKMHVVGATLELTRMKANPVRLKTIVDEEVERLKREK